MGNHPEDPGNTFEWCSMGGWNVAERWIGRAGPVVGGSVLFAFLIYLVWRWAVHHETWLKECRDELLQWPRLMRLRTRYAVEIKFVQARLTPGSYLGLRLTLGGLLLLGGAWVFGGIAEDVVTGDPLTHVDVQVANWLHAHATPGLTSFMRIVSTLHGPLAMLVWNVLVASFLVWHRKWRWLMSFLLTVPLGMLLNVGMKHLFRRARPRFDHPLLVLTSYSFPSGHTAASTLFYGFLAALIASHRRTWSQQVLAGLIAFAMVFHVAFSRMYLGAHYLSDVLAAVAEGVAWLSLCLTGVHTYEEHRKMRRSSG